MNIPPTKAPKGFTIIEVTVVIAILLILVGISVGVFGGYDRWRQGVEAGEKLQEVYAAQRLYLSDFPTVKVSELTADKVIPYLPTKATALPSVEDLDGNALTIDVSVSPPVLKDSGGTVYDPTDAKDGQWDTGT